MKNLTKSKIRRMGTIARVEAIVEYPPYYWAINAIKPVTPTEWIMIVIITPALDDEFIKLKIITQLSANQLGMLFATRPDLASLTLCDLKRN